MKKAVFGIAVLLCFLLVLGNVFAGGSGDDTDATFANYPESPITIIASAIMGINALMVLPSLMR